MAEGENWLQWLFLWLPHDPCSINALPPKPCDFGTHEVRTRPFIYRPWHFLNYSFPVVLNNRTNSISPIDIFTGKLSRNFIFKTREFFLLRERVYFFSIGLFLVFPSKVLYNIFSQFFKSLPKNSILNDRTNSGRHSWLPNRVKISLVLNWKPTESGSQPVVSTKSMRMRAAQFQEP